MLYCMCHSCCITDRVNQRVEILRKLGKPSWGKILSGGGTLFLPVRIFDHWLVFAAVGCKLNPLDEADVQVYDSFPGTRQYGTALARCVCKITYMMAGFKKIYRFVDKTQVETLPMEQNRADNQCGVHVVARAFQLAHGLQPSQFSPTTITNVRKWCVYTILSKNSEVCGVYSEWEKENNCLVLGDVPEDRTVARVDITDAF